eukprot:Partr_v1_DN27291_c0_g1_i1_m38474 putative Glycosyl hydrolase
MKPLHVSDLKKSASLSGSFDYTPADGADPADMLYPDGRWFKDAQGRVCMLRGVNLSGATKLPAHPLMPSHRRAEFFEHRTVSFVGRPFPLEDAEEHLTRLKGWGLLFLRFLVTWEAIEHSGPRQYDIEYFEYVKQVLLVAKAKGFKCFIDPHQDVWSRFTGGSGAPGWTVEMVGLDMTKFNETGAALVHNTFADVEHFPRMIWPTNYFKLACATMFTLFFGGKSFAPRCLVQVLPDGSDKMTIYSAGSVPPTSSSLLNIQDYLQLHFANSIKALVDHLAKTPGLLDSVVVGYDTLNEPSAGWLGQESIDKFPKHQELKNGATPTATEAMLLGHGVACEVENYSFGSLGSRRAGSVVIDPKGVSCWRQGYSCIWQAHGVYDPVSKKSIRPDYFSRHPSSGEKVDWVSDFWRPFVRLYTGIIRSAHKNAIMFVETPVNEIPPAWDPKEGDPKDRICFTPHWYDGITLINKHFSTWWTLDYTGYTRGRYCSILAAISLGLSGIKKNFAKQLGLIREEGLQYIGDTPFLLGEFGIPYDMNNRKSYLPGGNYKIQTIALDANLSALESCLLNYTLWNYCHDNSYKWGDNWNGEDLSIFSRDAPSSEAVNFLGSNMKFDLFEVLQQKVGSHIRKGTSASAATSFATDTTQADVLEKIPLNHQRSMTVPTYVDSYKDDINKGGRAISGFLRPYPSKTNGIPMLINFDSTSKTKLFKFSFKSSRVAVSPVLGFGTEIFVPRWHFGRPLALHLMKEEIEIDSSFIQLGGINCSEPLGSDELFFDVKVSSGTWSFDESSQTLHFFHGSMKEKSGSFLDAQLNHIEIFVVSRRDVAKRIQSKRSDEAISAH